jgi:hypothetical protein
MKIDFEPISSVKDAEELLAILEIRTLFYLSTYVSDIEWDEDELFISFLDEIEDPVQRRDYEVERTSAIDEAKNKILQELYALIMARHGDLKDNTPFEWDFDQDLLLQRRPCAKLNAVSLGYLWLSLFWLAQSEKDYLVMEPDDLKAFNTEFAKVFELICCYVISSKSDAFVWYLGDSRSNAEFLRRLESVTKACGTGSVTPPKALMPYQKGVNDGGVDVLAIETLDGVIHGNALAYLIGATIQQASRMNKVIGLQQQNRFSGFFTAKPLLAYKGVLAVPFERSPYDEGHCYDANCLYWPKEEILSRLGKLDVEMVRARLRHPELNLLRATRALSAKFRLADNDVGQSISWA